MPSLTAHTANIINRIGQPVTLTPSGQSSRVVNAVFTSKPAEVFSMVGGFAPTLRICAADSNDLALGDAITVSGKSFTVSGIDDDSADAGDRVLKLESA